MGAEESKANEEIEPIQKLIKSKADAQEIRDILNVSYMKQIGWEECLDLEKILGDMRSQKLDTLPDKIVITIIEAIE